MLLGGMWYVYLNVSSLILLPVDVIAGSLWRHTEMETVPRISTPLSQSCPDVTRNTSITHSNCHQRDPHLLLVPRGRVNRASPTSSVTSNGTSIYMTPPSRINTLELSQGGDACGKMKTSLRSGQNGSHFAYEIFKFIFLYEKYFILIPISLKFVPNGSIDNKPALVKIMVGDDPATSHYLSQLWPSLLTHTCVTRPQWVNCPYFRNYVWNARSTVALKGHHYISFSLHKSKFM